VYANSLHFGERQYSGEAASSAYKQMFDLPIGVDFVNWGGYSLISGRLRRNPDEKQ